MAKRWSDPLTFDARYIRSVSVHYLLLTLGVAFPLVVFFTLSPAC